MISIRLKDLCNQYGVFILTATQLNADYVSAQQYDQNLLRGAKAIADKINWMIDQGVNFIVIATKTDKLSKSQLNEALDGLQRDYFGAAGIRVIPFSSVTREGKDELWRIIEDAIA